MSDSSNWGTVDCAYSVVVRTSSKENAATTANVFVQLTDVDGHKTDKVRLKCSVSHRKKFQRGHSDLFLLIGQAPLANLKSIELWHEKKADCRPWLLESVYVIEHTHHNLYRFPCGAWLGKDTDEITSSIKLEPKGKAFPILQEDDL